jgi:hypothetical protein
MIKKLLVLFVCLISTTISNLAVSGDVAVSSTGNGSPYSWVVIGIDVYFCTARKIWGHGEEGKVVCIRASKVFKQKSD